jgi:TolB-like protein/Flp pilus assembly protein TadD
MVLCAAGGWAFFSRSPIRKEASIAVLPFNSADPSSRYLSSGLTDEITDALSQLKTLRVIASSSVARFSGKTADPREAGRMLGVANVLEGSVSSASNRVKIVAKLERVGDGALLWSETYERPESDLSAVQSDLTAGIAKSLKLTAPLKARHVPNAKAHSFLMKGRYEGQQMTSEAVKQAEVDFQHAIDLDPGYALAYLQLAVQKYNEGSARGSTYQTEEERKSSEQLLHKALELDPDLPSAHGMLAMFAMQYDWDWARAEREIRLAAAGPPSTAAELYFAFLLTFRGRFAEADEHIRRMQDLDPFSIVSMLNVAILRNLEGRFQEAREIAQNMLAISPKMLGAQQLIGATYAEEGHPELALPIFRQLEPRFPQIQLYEAMTYAAAGQGQEALRLIRPYEEKYPNPGVAMQWFALVYGALGDVKWLERSADRHEFQALNLAVNPVFASMRNSAGFRALEKRMGLLP